MCDSARGRTQPCSRLPPPDMVPPKGSSSSSDVRGHHRLISHTVLSKFGQMQSKGQLQAYFHVYGLNTIPPKDANESFKDRLIKTPAAEGRAADGGVCSNRYLPPSRGTGGHVLCMFSHPSLSPNEHSLKHLDKNQRSNKGKLIALDSPLAEIITLNEQLRSFRGRGVAVAGTPSRSASSWGASGRSDQSDAGSPEHRGPGTTRCGAVCLLQPRVLPSRPRARTRPQTHAAGTTSCCSPKPLLINQHQTGPSLVYLAKTQSFIKGLYAPVTFRAIY